MTAGNFLTGAFRLGAQIFDRQDARVEVSTEDSDNFRKNLVTILAEERLALAVYRPEAFIRGGFAAAITRSEEHTSELQSLMRLSYAVFCLNTKKKNNKIQTNTL